MLSVFVAVCYCKVNLWNDFPYWLMSSNSPPANQISTDEINLNWISCLTLNGSILSLLVFIYSMPGYSCGIRERMLYSSCKNPLLEMVENKLQMEVEKKVCLCSLSDCEYLIYWWNEACLNNSFFVRRRLKSITAMSWRPIFCTTRFIPNSTRTSRRSPNPAGRPAGGENAGSPNDRARETTLTIKPTSANKQTTDDRRRVCATQSCRPFIFTQTSSWTMHNVTAVWTSVVRWIAGVWTGVLKYCMCRVSLESNSAEGQNSL